jgi:hypothetical protein
MVVLIYLTNMALVLGLAVYIHHLLKQQIEDLQTISYLRGQNMKRREQILNLEAKLYDVEAKIKMIEVF